MACVLMFLNLIGRILVDTRAPVDVRLALFDTILDAVEDSEWAALFASVQERFGGG